MKFCFWILMVLAYTTSGCATPFTSTANTKHILLIKSITIYDTGAWIGLFFLLGISAAFQRAISPTSHRKIIVSEICLKINDISSFSTCVGTAVWSFGHWFLFSISSALSLPTLMENKSHPFILLMKSCIGLLRNWVKLRTCTAIAANARFVKVAIRH